MFLTALHGVVVYLKPPVYKIAAIHLTFVGVYPFKSKVSQRFKTSLSVKFTSFKLPNTLKVIYLNVPAAAAVDHDPYTLIQ